MKPIIPVVFIAIAFAVTVQNNPPLFKVIAFYIAKNDQAHISYVHEANRWFPGIAEKYNFQYDSTNDWNSLNEQFLAQYEVAFFLDTRPEAPSQREAFKKYMENGGTWIGFHFAGFALTPSAFNQDWDWYHNVFIGAGQYKGNTWRPTSAILRVEDKKHPATKNLPQTFSSSPNEWYSWEKDLKKILTLIYLYQLIQPVFRWVPALSSMKYGIATTTLLYGPTKNIRCFI